MINKVNAPAKLSLIKSTKNMENDPGASSGSGMAYERPPEQRQNSENHENADEKLDEKSVKLSLVPRTEKAGMTDVIVDFLVHKISDNNSPAPGLSTKYQSDHSRTKGLLLNKKAE